MTRWTIRFTTKTQRLATKKQKFTTKTQRTRRTERTLLALPVSFVLCALCAFVVIPSVSPSVSDRSPVRAVVLGIAQDGGVPHIGCRQPLCVAARRDPSRRHRVACLGLIDEASGERFLIDATPDLASQIDSVQGGRALANAKRPVDGILLTHAHIGRSVPSRRTVRTLPSQRKL